MALRNYTFTAVGAGRQIRLAHGDTVDWTVSGTFVGTAVLEQTKNGGLTWELLQTLTAAGSGSFKNQERGTEGVQVRFRCTAYTSGSIVTQLETHQAAIVILNGFGAPTNGTTGQGIAPSGSLYLDNDTGDLYINAGQVGGTQASPVWKRVDRSGHLKEQLTVSEGAKVGATAGWNVEAADDLAYLASLPASQTGSTLIIPITGLEIGAVVTTVNLVGRIESAGNTVTLDAEVRRHTAAAGAIGDAQVSTMTQIVATADTLLDGTNASQSPAETVSNLESLYVKVTGTTGALTGVDLIAVRVLYTAPDPV